VGRSDVKAQLLDQARQPWRLAFRQIQHQSRQRGGVDDRMLQRALQPATHQPRVECVVAVLDQDRALRKAKEGAPRVLEFGRPDQH
jgi:hypothetical protein